MALDLSLVAKNILNELGSFGYVKLVRKSITYNSVTGVQTSTDTTINLSAVDLPVPEEMIDGQRIVKTDKYFILSGDVEPKHSDLIEVNGKSYTIQEITPTNHAGVVQIYEVVGRG